MADSGQQSVPMALPAVRCLLSAVSRFETILVCGSIYGASLGAWHDARLAFYSAIKVPLLLLATATLTALFNWIIAALIGLPLKFGETIEMSLLPLAVASIILASCAPVIFFFDLSLPPPMPSARTLHNLLYLTHTALVAGAGVTGTTFLQRRLLEVCHGDARLARRVHAAWVVAFAFVGGEVSWILRPFIGSVYLPVVFLRSDALHGNVYEFIFTDILPHLWRLL
jgi:hypothetical protein